MQTYRVQFTNINYLDVDIEANSVEEATEIAQEVSSSSLETSKLLREYRWSCKDNWICSAARELQEDEDPAEITIKRTTSYELHRNIKRPVVQQGS